MKIRKKLPILNEAFDYDDVENTGIDIDSNIENIKKRNSFRSEVLGLLNHFRSFVANHYGDPDIFGDEPTTECHFFLRCDNTFQEAYLARYGDNYELFFRGPISYTHRDHLGSFLELLIDLKADPINHTKRNRMLSYNDILSLLDFNIKNLESIKYKIYPNGTKYLVFEPDTIDETSLNAYSELIDWYINYFESHRAPYEKIKLVQDLEAYKAKFKDLLYNLFTWCDINGGTGGTKKVDAITGKITLPKISFKRLGIPNMKVKGSIIYFSLVNLDPFIYECTSLVAKSDNNDNIWDEWLKTIGRFEFNWSQICFQGGSAEAIFETGKAIEDFLNKELEKLQKGSKRKKNVNESFDFDSEDNYEESFDTEISKSKKDYLILDLVNSFDDHFNVIDPGKKVIPLIKELFANSDFSLKYERGNSESEAYEIKIYYKDVPMRTFRVKDPDNIMYMETLYRLVMWVQVCILENEIPQIYKIIKEKGSIYKFTALMFDWNYTKEVVNASKKFIDYSKNIAINEGFDFENEEETGIMDSWFEEVHAIKDLANLWYSNDLQNWRDVEEIVYPELVKIIEPWKNRISIECLSAKNGSWKWGDVVFLNLKVDGKTANFRFYTGSGDHFERIHKLLHLICALAWAISKDEDKMKPIEEIAQSKDWNITSESPRIIYLNNFSE